MRLWAAPRSKGDVALLSGKAAMFSPAFKHVYRPVMLGLQG
jgi:hypothetical protein